MGFHILNTFDIFDGAIKSNTANQTENTKGFLKSDGEARLVSTDTTEWIVGHDRTNLKTYVRTYGGLKIQVVDFSRVGFEKPGLRTIEKKPASRIRSADADREGGSYCLELVPPNPLRVVRRRCSRGDSPRRRPQG